MHEATYAKQIAWLEWLKKRTGKSLAALSRDAGRSPNLLTRKIADGGLLSSGTIDLLVESTGLPGPETYQLPTSGGGGDEAEPFLPDSSDDLILAQSVRFALKGRNNAAAYVLRTRALEAAGYHPGDVVIVDAAAHPYAGDAVCGQIVELRSGRPELVFRMYEPPYLINLSGDSALRKPMPIDNERVIVVGPITQTFRTRGR